MNSLSQLQSPSEWVFLEKEETWEKWNIGC